MRHMTDLTRPRLPPAYFMMIGCVCTVACQLTPIAPEAEWLHLRGIQPATVTALLPPTGRPRPPPRLRRASPRAEWCRST
jgi:hypothetical protein